jgi:uncharacterized protein YqfB (UPF0267 family)
MDRIHIQPRSPGVRSPRAKVEFPKLGVVPNSPTTMLLSRLKEVPDTKKPEERVIVSPRVTPVKPVVHSPKQHQFPPSPPPTQRIVVKSPVVQSPNRNTPPVARQSPVLQSPMKVADRSPVLVSTATYTRNTFKMPVVVRDSPPENYILVPLDMWRYIPVGSHVICIRDDNVTKAGFVERHFKSAERRGLTLRSSPSTNQAKNVKRTAVDFEQLDIIYKKYSQQDFIELAEMKKMIDALTREVRELSAKVNK